MAIFIGLFANITPSYDVRNKVIGYYSVRRKAPASMIAKLEPLYQHMLNLEEKYNTDKEEGIRQALFYLLEEVSKIGKDYDDALLSLFNNSV